MADGTPSSAATPPSSAGTWRHVQRSGATKRYGDRKAVLREFYEQLGGEERVYDGVAALSTAFSEALGEELVRETWAKPGYLAMSVRAHAMCVSHDGDRFVLRGTGAGAGVPAGDAAPLRSEGPPGAGPQGAEAFPRAVIGRYDGRRAAVLVEEPTLSSFLAGVRGAFHIDGPVPLVASRRDGVRLADDADLVDAITVLQERELSVVVAAGGHTHRRPCAAPSNDLEAALFSAAERQLVHSVLDH
eukprot:gene3223-165_t